MTIEILNGCLTAASDTDYEYIYREDHDDAHDYSIEYVKTRQEQEVASFVVSEDAIGNASPFNVNDVGISNSEDTDLETPVSRKRMNEDSPEPARKHM